MINKVLSYTAASTLPIKLLRNSIFDNIGRVQPKHVQINPTNVCNLHCSFCSCEEREKNISMDFQELKDMLKMFRTHGCEAVTITGGGEPLLYRHINDLIVYICANLHLKAGLVTNGTCLNRLNDEAGNHLTWVRISLADEREIPNNEISSAMKRIKTDWAFSYVMSSSPNMERLSEAIYFANANNFTHMRVVSDLLDLESVPDMQQIKQILSDIDTSRIIFQGRKEFTKGVHKCFISLLKPVVDARGDLYPCCGAQYAMDPPELDYGKKTKMGNWKDFPSLYNKQAYFDGLRCVRCYYSQYNKILEAMTSSIEHVEFV